MGTRRGGDILMDKLTFTWEPILYLRTQGLGDMSYRHWLEAQTEKELLPYDPDWNGYVRLEKANNLRIIAVRWSGNLIGYAVVRIFDSLQSKGVACSYIQEYYIELKFRKRGAPGLKLFRFIQDQLKIMKVRQVTTHFPEMVRSDRGGLGKFFKFLGYKPAGHIWTRSV